MTDDGLPKDPSTPLGDAGAHMHEQFKTLVEQGFTEWQALRLLGVIMAELIRAQK